MLRPIYDNFPYQFSRARLEGMVEKTVGKAYLDGWVDRGAPGQSFMRMRAIGTRNLHIIAGNVPVTAAITVVRSALCKCDCLIKMPSNDPYTAAAIVQSMIDLDPDHPVTKHFAVAYWKGGDEAVERQVLRPSRIEKLTAWGGMASMVHINKYLVPGIELIAMNPKLSISIVGHEALETGDAMEEAARGVATMAGHMNQTACSTPGWSMSSAQPRTMTSSGWRLSGTPYTSRSASCHPRSRRRRSAPTPTSTMNWRRWPSTTSTTGLSGTALSAAWWCHAPPTNPSSSPAS